LRPARERALLVRLVAGRDPGGGGLAGGADRDAEAEQRGHRGWGRREGHRGGRQSDERKPGPRAEHRGEEGSAAATIDPNMNSSNSAQEQIGQTTDDKAS
jgi:hypothetical protein